jgi:hypothetical protein
MRNPPISRGRSISFCSTTTLWDVFRRLAPLKREAKGLSGSSGVVGRPGSDRINILRGTRKDPLPKTPVVSRKPW